MDRHRNRIGRARRADPEDPRGPVDDLRARARAEGPQVLTEALQSRARWAALGPDLRHAAVADIARRLGPAFLLEDLRDYRCNGQQHAIAAFRHQRLDIRFHLIPGGAFTLGSPTAGPNSGCAIPERELSIPPFLIAQMPLLGYQWDRLEDPAIPPEDRPAPPKTGLTWLQVKDWLARAGDGLRLPSEAEWEYAARAGTHTAYFWGPALRDAYCWYLDNARGEAQDPRRHLRAGAWNAFGLVDTLGNVWEWCEDNFRPDYSQGPVDHRPHRDASDIRSLRGGGANSRVSMRGLGCASRGARRADVSSSLVGFRPALGLPS